MSAEPTTASELLTSHAGARWLATLFIEQVAIKAGAYRPLAVRIANELLGRCDVTSVSGSIVGGNALDVAGVEIILPPFVLTDEAAEVLEDVRFVDLRTLTKTDQPTAGDSDA